MIVALIWALNWSVLKIGLRYASPLSFLFQRLLFSAVAMFPLLVILRRRVPRDRRTLKHLFILSMINVLFWISSTLGLSLTSSGVSAVLTYIQPIFVFCLAVAFLGEEADGLRLLGVILGSSGVLILSAGNGTLSGGLYSSLLLLAGAFFWAVTIVYYKKFLAATDPIVTNILQFTIGTFALALISIPINGTYFPPSEVYGYVILYNAIFVAIIAWTLWVFLLREEDAIDVSSSSLVIPIMALFLGWVILGETIELKTLLATLLILTGVYLVNRRTGAAPSKTEEIKS
jgi:drug/metabolite transporter (DMT)-like permease